MSNSSKMYICVRDDVADFMVPTLVGHAVLRHHLEVGQSQEFLTACGKKWPEWLGIYDGWITDSFKKCVVRMNKKEFTKVLAIEGGVKSWENSTLNGEVSCVTVVVDKDVPNVLKFAKLWSPKND